MFEQSLILDSGARRNPWSFAASVTVQSVLVAAALAVPLLHVAQIDTRLPGILFLPRAIGAAEPVHQAPQRGAASSVLSVLHVGRTYRPFQAPSRIPTHVATGPDLPGAPEYAFSGGGGSGDPNGFAIPGIVDLGQRALPLAPPVEPQRRTGQPVTQPVSIRVGSSPQAAKLIFGPRPAYPALAKQARISGTVRLAARISADGRIRDLQVVSGHPMLIPAALEAVRQWIYKPTLLNGQPVEVVTDIVVNFVLNQ